MSLDVEARHRDNCVSQYRAHVQAIAHDLRKIADDVERIGLDPRTDLRTMQPDYVETAAGVLHRVMWGMANLGLEAAVKWAADVDRLNAMLNAGG